MVVLAVAVFSEAVTGFVISANDNIEFAVLDVSDGNKDGTIDDAYKIDVDGSGAGMLWDDNFDYIPEYRDIVESLPSLSMRYYGHVKFDHYYTLDNYGHKVDDVDDVDDEYYNDAYANDDQDDSGFYGEFIDWLSHLLG